MTKFSVRKPLTVFVAVVAIIVLGIVAYTEMTPDLLPNMDLPYMVVMTTYPGASPEKVEDEVTRPLEQSMATLEHIDTVQSVSSENYSMIILAFDSDVNMDSVTVDILQKVDQIEGGWDDMVSTPYIMKINPDVLPVVVAAVDMADMDTEALSVFVDQILMNQLEGISGVASVSASGTVERSLNVVLSQDKIDGVNAQIRRAIDSQFDESEAELLDAKAELEENLEGLEEGQAAMDQAKDQLPEAMGEASATINENQMAIIEGKSQINAQITQLTAQLEELRATRQTLAELQSSIAQLEAAERELTATIALLEEISANLSSLEAAEAAFNQQIAAIQANTALSPEEKQAAIDAITGSEEYRQVTGALAAIDAQLAARGLTRAGVGSALAGAKTGLAEVQMGLATIDASLAAMGMSRGDVVASVAELDGGIAQIEAGISQMETVLAGLEDGSVQLNQAMAELEKQRTSALLEMSEGTAQMLLGSATLTQALEQVEDGLEQMDDFRRQAYDQADMTDVITMNMVSGILYAQNFSMPAGYIEDDGVRYLVSVGDEFGSDTEIEDLLLLDLGMDGVDPIYLTDVADVFWIDNMDDIYAKVNGNNGVVLSFSKQSNYATAEVSDNIAEKFDQLAEEYEGLGFTNLMDQGDYINLVVGAILQNLISGAILAIIILFFFLRDIRPTAITLAAIPISVVFAIVLMYFSGITLNMISLSGLAVAVGMLVDNSVVVIENVYRLRSKGVPAVKAAVTGARQVSGAIVASTLTTVSVFLPIVFVEGITRQLFTDLALTLGFALVASLIIALTLVPAMSAGMMKTIRNTEMTWFNRLVAGYEKSLRWMLSRKPLILGAAVMLLVASAVIALSRGFSFMPDMDMDQLTATMEMPEGSTFAETTEMADTLSDRILTVEGVDTVGAMVSGGSMFSLSADGDSTTVSLYILLDEGTRRSMGAIREDVEAAAQGLDCEFSASSSSDMDISALSGSGVSVRLLGDDLDDLQQAAREVADLVAGIEGTVNVSDGQEDNEPQLSIVVDRERAMAHGLTIAQIYQEIAAQLTTEATATTLRMDGNSYDIVVGSGTDDSLDRAFLERFTFTVTDGEGEEEEIRLVDMADIRETESMSTINRSDQVRYTAVTAELEEGYNVTLVTQEAERLMRDYSLPGNTYYEFTGENETIMEAMGQLALMLVLGVLLVYLIMVAQFQSLKSPFIVMFTIPLAFTGGLLALVITGRDVSVISMIGFVMLVGIIVNNGIVLVDYINQLRAQGGETREAVVEAGMTRMRPILMTSITTIFGLVFMALGVGTGAAMMQPIAIVCIGGLLYATVLTLYVVPCLYEMMNKKPLRVVTEEDMEYIEK